MVLIQKWSEGRRLFILTLCCQALLLAGSVVWYIQAGRELFWAVPRLMDFCIFYVVLKPVYHQRKGTGQSNPLTASTKGKIMAQAALVCCSVGTLLWSVLQTHTSQFVTYGSITFAEIMFCSINEMKGLSQTLARVASMASQMVLGPPKPAARANSDGTSTRRRSLDSHGFVWQL